MFIVCTNIGGAFINESPCYQGALDLARDYARRNPGFRADIYDPDNGLITTYNLDSRWYNERYACAYFEWRRSRMGY